jgi:hypothetical protein
MTCFAGKNTNNYYFTAKTQRAQSFFILEYDSLRPSRLCGENRDLIDGLHSTPEVLDLFRDQPF